MLIFKRILQLYNFELALLFLPGLPPGIAAWPPELSDSFKTGFRAESQRRIKVDASGEAIGTCAEHIKGSDIGRPTKCKVRSALTVVLNV